MGQIQSAIAQGHPTPFVGRAKELGDVTARLINPECRLLTVTGLGGSGKTRLAIEAANAVAAHFAQGAVFVALQPLTRSELLVPTIAQAVGLTFHGRGEPHEQLLDYLHEKRLLLILDNFEHLLDGVALVNEMLAYAPGIKALVTSREALQLVEEWLYPLKGMSTPPSVYSIRLEDYEAVQLFLYHARRVQPNFDLANEHEPVIRICELTAGLPLALELAASWLKGLSCTQIAQEIQRNLDFLSTTMRNVEQRHRSMRAVFDQSWKLLSESEQLIFARLTVFSGGFDSSAAAQVAGASLADLAALVEKSLLQIEAAGRFGIHELLRQYGVEKLEAYGETQATYARHSHYFAQLMLQHEAALKQPQQSETMRAIEIDFENIRLAWDWSARHQQTAHLHTMLNGLYLFGFLRSRYRETITMFQQALEHYVSDTPLLGRLLARRWGYLHWLYYTDYQAALADIERALAIAQAENNRFEIAFCHLMAAYAMISTQRHTEALSHLESSKTLFEAINDLYYVCWALHRIGYVYYNLHNSAIANEYTEQSLSIARATHNRVAQVICLYNLGSDYILSSDYAKGQQYCMEALQVATSTGNRDQIAHALSLLALCAFCQGDYDTCQKQVERSWAIVEDINSLLFEPYNRALLILLACLRENYTQGIQLNELKDHNKTNKMGLQLLYWSLSVLSCGVGNSTEAHANIQKCLHVSGANRQSALIAWLAPSLAYTLVETDQKKAVELLAWAFAYPDTALGWARQWPLLGRLQAQLQAAIDPDVYRAHWEKGATLSVDSIDTYLQQALRSPAADQAEVPQLRLTARENEILRLMAAGMTNPQIAEQLVIGAGTVKTHTLNIYRKLEVANRTQALSRARELGLLEASI